MALKIFVWEHWSMQHERWDCELLKHIAHEKVQTIGECDIIVCADITSNDHKINTGILQAALTLKSEKPLIVFMPDDPEDSSCLLFPEDERRLVVFRTSLGKSIQAFYEKAMPTFSSERITMFPFDVSNYSQKPQIGFCGTFHHSSRRLCCEFLQKDSRIETIFIERKNFHLHQDVQTQSSHKQEFEKVMKLCAYQLCGRGAGNFSHRFYETLAYGRIPVLLDTDMCLPAHIPEALWNECIVMVKNVEDLADAILFFHAKNMHDALETVQGKCRKLWDEYLCAKAFATLVVEPDMKRLIHEPLPNQRKFIEAKCSSDLYADFGGLNVTKLLPHNEKFVVSVNLFSDPTPNVYKFLNLTRDDETICVGEGDTIHDVDKLFDTYDLPNCKTMALLTPYLQRKKGLEIGGPSSYGVRASGIYSLPLSLDNVHISDPAGPFLLYSKNTPGSTFSSDIVNVSKVFLPNTFDFVFASHVLEHVKNPLKALVEIGSILRPHGYCILILPYKEVTFDHRRPITEFKELLSHFDNNETEDDVMDHVTPELLELYDFSRDVPAGTKDEFVERCRNNVVNRCLHIHVFDFKLIKQCFDFAHFKSVYMQLADGHQIMIGQKYN